MMFNLERHFRTDGFLYHHSVRWLKPTAKDSATNKQFSRSERYPCLRLAGFAKSPPVP